MTDIIKDMVLDANNQIKNMIPHFIFNPLFLESIEKNAKSKILNSKQNEDQFKRKLTEYAKELLKYDNNIELTVMLLINLVYKQTDSNLLELMFKAKELPTEISSIVKPAPEVQ